MKKVRMPLSFQPLPPLPEMFAAPTPPKPKPKPAPAQPMTQADVMDAFIKYLETGKRP